MTDTATKWFRRHGIEYKGAIIAEFPNKGYALIQQEKFCKRCGGAGGSEAWKHTGWTCFDCGGSGGRHFVRVKVYTAEKLAKLDAARDKSNARKNAERLAKIESQKEQAATARLAWCAANPEAWEFLDRNTPKTENEGDSFYWSLYRQLFLNGCLSEKQTAILNQRVEREKERVAALANSAHVGAIGERRSFFLKVVKTVALFNPDEYNQFGRRYLFICRDEAGRAILYKGNADVMHDLPPEGGEVQAKVKAHDEYNGEKQTVIERPTKKKGV